MTFLKKKSSHWPLFPYVVIAAIILAFNVISIWGFDGLYQDDQEYYFRMYDKNIGDLHFSRNIVHAIYILEISKIASITSIYTARLLIVLLMALPCAFFLFNFAHKHFRLQKSISLAIAIIPFILSNEVILPAYVVGSYMLLAILFSMITIFFLVKISKAPGFSNIDFILAAIFYFLAFESSELIAFMLPVFLFLIFALQKITMKRIYLGAVFSFLAIGKSLLVVQKPHGPVNNVSNAIPVPEIHRRIIHFLDYINPLEGLGDTALLNIILLAVILFGCILVIIHRKWIRNVLIDEPSDKNTRSRSQFLAIFYLFPWIWLVFSVIPFIFFSQYLTSRYLIMAAIALNFMFIVSFSMIVRIFSKNDILLTSVLLLLVASSGFHRQVNFKKYFSLPKAQYAELRQSLEGIGLDNNSQIVVTTFNQHLTVGNGITRRSNGVLQFILNRRDITCQIMVEKSYYDPFRIFNKPWEFRSVDIDTTKKTIFLRCFHADRKENQRMHYALRWLNENSKESGWTLYHMDDNMRISNILNGKGYAGYEYAIDSLQSYGIQREDILFGGIPDRNDSLRLGI